MCNKIIMYSDTYVVTKVIKKTQAKFFEDLKVGDKIRFSMPIGRVGRNRGLYASYVRTTDLGRCVFIQRSMDELNNRLQNFELEKEQ